MKKQNQQNVPKDQTRKIIISFVVVSLFLHFLIALCFTKYGEYFANTWEQKREQIEEPKIQFVEVAELDRMRGELAEQDKANENKPLKDAKFLSEKNNTVDKETKAAHRGDFQNKKNTQFTEAKAAAQAREQSVPELKSADMETFSHGDIQAPAKKPKKAQTISDLRLNAVQEMSNTAASDASQTNDYLKDVAIGAETHLNTREFLYYTYFNRIKKKLRQNWEPLIHSRVREMARSGRQVASEINGPKVTRLVITLDDKGGLSKVQISTTSGLLDLDDVALEALRVSAPFPNPPKDLIENGYVRINWDFILES